MSEFEWVVATRPSPRRTKARTPEYVIDLLKNNPFQTAVLCSFESERSARGCSSTIRLNKRKGFTEGKWDSWVQQGGKGWQVVVVYLGEVAAPSGRR